MHANSAVEVLLNSEQRGDERKVIASRMFGADVVGIYSPEKINNVCASFGLSPDSSLDLTTG